MTNKTTMPEPVAFRWRAPIVDSDGRQCGESDWKFGTEKGGHPWWTRDNLITTAQAEAYADARVRVALEEAASIARENYLAAYAGRVGVDEDDNDDRNTEIFNVGQVAQALAYSRMEEAIRALIPPTE